MIYRIKVIFLILMSLIFMMGCHKTEENKVEITLIHGWGSTEENHASVRRIYEDFERDNPDIKLNMISMPSAIDVVSKVGDLLSVGNIPDIIFLAGDGRESIYEFMTKKGYALNLMPYIEEDEDFQKNISPSAFRYWTTQENEIYTLSDVLMISGGYWYNKNIFEKAGIEKVPYTWKEWFHACEKIKEYALLNNEPVNTVEIDYEQITYLLSVLLYDEGSQIPLQMQRDPLDMNSRDVTHALQKLENIAAVSTIINSMNFRDSLEDFNEGKTGMYINGVWASSLIEEGLNVAYAPFPTSDGKGVSAVSSATGYILGNTGNEKRMEASVRFLKYMLSEPVAYRLLTETGQIPSNPNLGITEEIAGERLYQAVEIVKKREDIIEVPANIWGSAGKEKYGNLIISYLGKKITLEELSEKIKIEEK